MAFTNTYSWQRGDKVVDVGILGSCNDLLHTDISGVITVSDVIGDGAIKQDWLLRHQPDLRSQPLNVEGGQATLVKRLNENNINTIS